MPRCLCRGTGSVYAYATRRMNVFKDSARVATVSGIRWVLSDFGANFCLCGRSVSLYASLNVTAVSLYSKWGWWPCLFFLFIFLCSATCFQNFKPSHSVSRLTAHSPPFCRFLALLVSDGSFLPFMCSSSLFPPPLLPRLWTSFSSPFRPPSWWDVAVSNCRLAIRG